MTPEHAEAASSRITAAFSRTADVALTQTTFILITCATLGKLSGHGAAPFLAASVLVFGLSGFIIIGRALGAEHKAAHDLAAKLYTRSLANLVTCYASLLALGMVGVSVES